MKCMNIKLSPKADSNAVDSESNSSFNPLGCDCTGLSDGHSNLCGFKIRDRLASIMPA